MALAEALEKIRQGCTELDLRGNGVGAEGAKELAAVLTTNTALTELYLGGCGIGDEGAKELAAALTNNTALTELALRGNGIGNEGAKELAAALKTNTTLTTLRLAGNDIGHEGAKELAAALKTNTALTELHLMRNGIGDEGAKELAAALETNATLTKLDLRDNDINDQVALDAIRSILSANKARPPASAAEKVAAEKAAAIMEAAEITVSSCSSPAVLAAATYVYETHYSKPYATPAADAKSAYYMDLEPVPAPPRPGIPSVHRANHGLANALRKACLVPEVAAALVAKQGDHYSFLPETLHAMQVAMLFEVCGRESDIGFSDDPGPPNVFMQYHKVSCAAFSKWATPANLLSAEDAAVCLDALERMYMEPKTPASAPVKAVFEACHDLDLFRCYGGSRMQEKVSELKQLVGEEEGERLARLAVQMIKQTGDRLLFSPFADLLTGGYDLRLFPKCSHDAQACLKAIDSAMAPVGGVSPAVNVMLRPGPPVDGESKIRFVSSRYKLLHEAQKLKWDRTNWDAASLQTQKKDLRQAVKALVKAYCSRNEAYRNADHENYADEFLEGMTGANSEDISVWMWTSAQKTADLGVELCSILNEALRVDVGSAVGDPQHKSVEAQEVSPMLQPAVLLTCMLQRFLNASRRVKNGTALELESWPDGDGVNSTAKDTTYRGGGLPAKHFAFFKALAGTKQWYRAAHPLASSFIKKKARHFTDMQNDRPDPFEPSTDMPKVLFIIELDPEGCLQGNYLEKAGQVKGEKEFLFSAYSAFQVVSAKSGYEEELDTSGVTFEITIKACRDNKDVSDDVPTAPWH